MKNDFLHNKKDGFKLPDNYFQEFEEKLMNSVSLGSSSNIPDETGFTVPDNYFEDAELLILSEIEKEKIRTKTHFRKRKFSYAISAVAAILIIVLLAVGIYKPVSEEDPVAISEIEKYFQEGYLPLNSYELGDVFSDEISKVSITTSIEDDAIIDYLSTYNVTPDEQ